jgi:hypothetical protein
MPNWCYNSLVITGEADVIAKIRAQVSAPYETQHFDFVSGTSKPEKVEQPFSYWNIIKPTDLDAYHDKPNGKQDGHDHWYNWNLRNWGVKWDASDVYESDSDDKTLVYTFQSPWGIPSEALSTLSKQHPTASLELEFEEETGWGGTILFENGTEEVTEEYNDKCRQCGTLDQMEMCDNCENYLCTKCNYGEFIDEDTLKECETHKHLVKETVNG